jgi:hypothetical protein
MNAIFTWMSDLGIRLDDREPDARQLAHMAAVRDAKRQAGRTSSLLARLVRRLGFEPNRATTDPLTSCCAA